MLAAVAELMSGLIERVKLIFGWDVPHLNSLTELYAAIRIGSITTGFEVGDGVGVGVGATDGVGVGIGFAVGLSDGVGVGFIATPLFQRSLLPCLTQVCLIFETVFVEPAFVHLVPAIVAEFAGAIKVAKPNTSAEATTLFTRAMSIA
jgi:hypothetical protein